MTVLQTAPQMALYHIDVNKMLTFILCLKEGNMGG